MTPLAIVLFATAASDGPVGEPPAGRTAETARVDHDAAESRAATCMRGGSGCSADIVVPAAHGLGLMTVMRATETVLWPDPFARARWFGAHYEEAFTRPPVFDADRPFMRWDGDSLFINAGLHGLFGSELYLRARQCRLGWGGALAFAAATSAVWEYGFEANGVRPSAQDLVYTPLMGLLLGEARYVLHQTAGAMRSSAARGAVRAVLDPFGEIERAAGAGC